MNHRLTQALLIVATLAVLGGAGYFISLELRQPRSVTNQPDFRGSNPEFARFSSPQDFNRYLQAVAQQTGDTTLLKSADFRSSIAIEPVGSAVGLGAPEATGGSTVDRVSSTNVQVTDIDEPDIVKTDGQNIYVSSDNPYVYALRDLSVGTSTAPASNAAVAPDSNSSGSGRTGVTVDPVPSKIAPPIQAPATTSVIGALPPESMSKLGTIDAAGEMILVGKTLIVLAQPQYPDHPATRLVGYSVEKPSAPEQRWTNTLENTASIVSARLRQGQLYVVLQNQLVRGTPCPVKALTVGNESLSVPCAEIYHPIQPVATDTTYSVLKIDPTDGSVDNRLTFTGSANGTVVAMFADNLYVSYTNAVDPVTYEYDFFTQTGQGLLPAAYQERLRKLQDYDLSMNAKVTELSSIFEEYMATLGPKEQEQLSKTMDEKRKQFAAQHQRDYVATDIVRISLNNFGVAANGRVPGVVLNQYALDEYQNHLRIATTSNGGNSWWFGTSAESVNDVYVLDQSLKTTSSVLDMGRSERIYAVRFVGGLGYVVTFRQTDPFYVLNLTNPNAATLAGELKIPGYSSYLHPLSDTLILGIGQEDSRVKATLFDVSKPEQPAALNTFALDQYSWSEVQTNPHAFLHDAKHQVVFLPAGTKGIVLSYANNALKTLATVEQSQARRAVYINDTLYIIGETSITALNESTWAVVKKLTLN